MCPKMCRRQSALSFAGRETIPPAKGCSTHPSVSLVPGKNIAKDIATNLLVLKAGSSEGWSDENTSDLQGIIHAKDIAMYPHIITAEHYSKRSEAQKSESQT